MGTLQREELPSEESRAAEEPGCDPPAPDVQTRGQTPPALPPGLWLSVAGSCAPSWAPACRAWAGRCEPGGTGGALGGTGGVSRGAGFGGAPHGTPLAGTSVCAYTSPFILFRFLPLSVL